MIAIVVGVVAVAGINAGAPSSSEGALCAKPETSGDDDVKDDGLEQGGFTKG